MTAKSGSEGTIMADKNPIMENIHDLRMLERLFRQQPEAFRAWLAGAMALKPDSETLMAWKERLDYSDPDSTSRSTATSRDFVIMLMLAAVSGIITRLLPLVFEGKPVLPLNMASSVLACVTAFLSFSRPVKPVIRLALAAVFAVPLAFINILPDFTSDSTVLAYMHLPILLWLAMGLAFAGDSYKDDEARLSFIKFNGQFAIIYLSMAGTGMLLAVLTNTLFSVIGLEISEFYFENVVLFGAASLAVVAAYLASGNLKLAKAIAPYLARIFSPLILATLVVFLGISAWLGKNPLSDRDFLLSFNFLLIAALAVTMFSIAERADGTRRDVGDYVNAALIALSIAVDGIALFSILFRLASYGITPNRVAVLGMNVAVLANLFLVLVSYVGFLGGRSGIFPVQKAITRYLPVYGAWAAAVVFLFPVIF